MRGKRNKKTRGFFKRGWEVSFLKVLKLLEKSGAKYLIVGGVAGNLHGLSRTTKDIDLLIPKDLENARKILGVLSQLTWGIAKEISAEEVIAKPVTIIGDQPRVDLLLVAGKTKFEDANQRKETRTIEGIKIPFVSLDDFLKSKQTDRPLDALVVEEIKKLKKL